MSEPERPPTGFIVSAAGRFTPEGDRVFQRATRRLLWNLADNTRLGAAVINAISAFAPQRHVIIGPDMSPCGEWTRNAHARGVQVAGIDLGAEVLFTPRCWQFGGVWDARAVLFHEIIHALRHLTTSWSSAAGPIGYPNLEEFHATTVTNVLRSELKLPLRLGYTFPDNSFAELVSSVRRATAFAPPAGNPGTLQMRAPREMPSFHIDTELRPPPREPDLIAFSSWFAGRHPAVRGLFSETPLLADMLAALPWSVAPFNPYRALRSA